MATIKSYTDLQQSRRLTEILPLESADMFLAMNGTLPVMSKYIDDGLVTADETAIPCWSLAALLEIIKKLVGYSLQSLDTHTVFMNCELGDKPYNIETKNYDNPVDACVEMILKLNKIKML